MISIVLLGLLALLSYMAFLGRPKKFPKGPMGLPIVGYLPFLNRVHPEVTLKKLEKYYGKVFGIQFGSKDAVVIGDFEILKDVFSKMEVAGRPELYAFSMFSEGVQRGVILSSGKKWQTLRRFCLRHMKDVGMVKTDMNNIISMELEEMIEDLNKKNGKPVSMTDVLTIPILNIIWNIIAGIRMSHGDPEFLEVMKELCNNFEKIVEVMNISFLPDAIVKIIPGSFYDFDRISGVDKWFKVYSKKLISELRETYDSNHMRHVIDYYFKEMDEAEDDTTVFSDEELIYLIGDFFSAGAETTTTTIKYAVLFLLHNPHVQKRIQEELDFVIGTSRVPTLDDRGSLHYFEAFLNEVQRAGDIVPLGVFHLATSDVKLGEYILPKDTMLIGNLHSIHTDEKYWREPQKFDPERFMEDGKCIQNKDGFAPFSLGKRRCIGEPLARAELFLILSGLLQKFTFKVPVGQHMPPITRRPGIVSHPDEYDVSIVPRH